jgi:hypothetical protein
MLPIMVDIFSKMGCLGHKLWASGNPDCFSVPPSRIRFFRA